MSDQGGTGDPALSPVCPPQPYIEEICQNLRGDIFQKFIER